MSELPYGFKYFAQEIVENYIPIRLERTLPDGWKEITFGYLPKKNMSITLKNNEEIKVGDKIRINTLVVTVNEIKHEGGETFYSTDYGDFNSSICVKVNENLPTDSK